MNKKVFSTPTDVHYGQFNAPQNKAINFVEDNIRNSIFEFKPPYDIAQYKELIGTLLGESDWNLSINNGTWKLTPKI